jgi:hypothetical protein
MREIRLNDAIRLDREYRNGVKAGYALGEAGDRKRLNEIVDGRNELIRKAQQEIEQQTVQQPKLPSNEAIGLLRGLTTSFCVNDTSKRLLWEVVAYFKQLTEQQEQPSIPDPDGIWGELADADDMIGKVHQEYAQRVADQVTQKMNQGPSTDQANPTENQP